MARVAIHLVGIVLGLGIAFAAESAWTVADGVARSAAEHVSIVVACADDANGMRIVVEGRGWRPGPASVRLFGGAAEPLELPAFVDAHGMASFDDDDEDRAWARLLTADRLVLTLRSPGWFATASVSTHGFADAFALLGCAPQDACPARSCGP